MCARSASPAGPDKCRYVKDELGFDECLDHRAPDLASRLARRLSERHRYLFRECRRTGAGGGAAAAQCVCARADLRHHRQLQRHRAAARSQSAAGRYGAMILTRRLTVRGLLVTDFAAMHDDFLRDVSAWMREGRIKYREDVVDGFENAPQRADRAPAGREFRQDAGTRRRTKSFRGDCNVDADDLAAAVCAGGADDFARADSGGAAPQGADVARNALAGYRAAGAGLAEGRDGRWQCLARTSSKCRCCSMC